MTKKMKPKSWKGWVRDPSPASPVIAHFYCTKSLAEASGVSEPARATLTLTPKRAKRRKA